MYHFVGSVTWRTGVPSAGYTATYILRGICAKDSDIHLVINPPQCVVYVRYRLFSVTIDPPCINDGYDNAK